jgi:two-component system sensor histidine kinase UhpB
MGPERGDPGAPPDPLRAIAQEIASITAENARLLQRLGEGEKRFRLISRGILRVQEAERGRISRELHDGVGQSLTALKMQLQLLEQAAPRDEPALSSRLAELREMADRSLQEVWQISHLLRPQMLDELGLLPTLRWLARTFQQRTGIEAELVSEGIDERMDLDLETLVYRLVQEALTNAAKHSRAARVRIVVRRPHDRLLLSVEDGGAGFDVAEFWRSTDEDRGFGLRGMRDRVHLFAGQFTVTSQPGAGTTIVVEIPLSSEGKAQG